MKLTALFTLCGLLLVGSTFAAEQRTTGPVVDAADATQRAVIVANRVARSYDVRPFSDPKATAVRDGEWWTWRGLVAYGKGDLEVTVRLRHDGTGLYHRVVHLVSVSGWGF